MKHLCRFAFAVLTFAVGISDAEAARHRFWGGMVITNTGAACTNGSETNSKYAVRFRTAGLGDGDTSTISLFRSESARNFEVSGKFTSAFKSAKETDIFDYAASPATQVKIKFTAQSPATITATTLNVTATGQIGGWDEVPNCILTFRMSVTKRVE